MSWQGAVMFLSSISKISADSQEVHHFSDIRCNMRLFSHPFPRQHLAASSLLEDLVRDLPWKKFQRSGRTFYKSLINFQEVNRIYCFARTRDYDLCCHKYTPLLLHMLYHPYENSERSSVVSRCHVRAGAINSESGSTNHLRRKQTKPFPEYLHSRFPCLPRRGRLNVNG